MDDGQNSSHYQAIDIAEFRQTVMEKARMGKVPDHDRSSSSRRMGKNFMEEQQVNYQNYYSGHGGGSISDTPPNTPSSGESSTSLDLTSSSRRVRISPIIQEHALRDFVKNASRVPNADPGAPQTSPFSYGHEPGQRVQYENSPNENNLGTENFWIGQRLAEKQLDTRAPMLRSYWEANLERERQEQERQAQFQQQRRRPFGFPKWRSNDPMSASLVASKKMTELIPKDSMVPRERIQKLEEKERQAEMEKRSIHQKSESRNNLQKGKSLDSLNMQLDYQPWYDRQRIREAISRESIANIGATRDKFERNTPTPNRYTPNYASDYRQRAQSTTPYSRRHENGINYRAVTPSAESEQHFVQKPEQPFGYNQPRERAHSPYRSQHRERAVSPHKSSERNVHSSHQNSQNSQTPDPSNDLSPEHYYLLQYIKQNQALFSDLGVSIPKNLLTIAGELPAIPVELKSPIDRSQHNISRISNRSPFQGALSPTQSQTPVQYVPPMPQKNGRYVKNMAGNYQQRFRRLYDVSNKPPPENKKETFQELELHKAGDSLIAAEIRSMREREEELRREREEREKYIQQFWSPNPGNHLRSAISYDQLNQGRKLNQRVNSSNDLIAYENHAKNPMWMSIEDPINAISGNSSRYTNVTSDAEILLSPGTNDSRHSAQK